MRWRVLAVVLVVAIAAILHSRARARAERRELVRAAIRRFRRVSRVRARQRIEQSQREPPVFAALRELHTAFGNGNWTALLEIGDVYRKGSYPTHRPNQDLALRLYRAACGSPDPSIAGAAQIKFMECRIDPIADEDIRGVDLPPGYGEDCIVRAHDIMTVSHYNHRPSAPVVRHVPIEDNHRTSAPAPRLAITSDKQNVHDHSIVQGISKSLGTMSSGADAKEDVTMYILESGASPEAKSDALAVLHTFGDSQHSTFEVSENAALNKVWARIQSLDSREKRDASDILVSQLASGVESGRVVCSTGKIARVVSTFDGLGDDPVIVPLWAVREELGTLAARVRDVHDDPDIARNEFRKAAAETYAHISKDLLGGMVDDFATGF
jgi:hypothetical protein